MHCIMKEVTEWLEKKRWQNYPRFWSLVQDWLQSLTKLLNFSNFVELFLLAVCFYFLFSCTHFLETFFYYFFASMFAYLSSIKFSWLQFFFFFFKQRVKSSLRYNKNGSPKEQWSGAAQISKAIYLNGAFLLSLK